MKKFFPLYYLLFFTFFINAQTLKSPDDNLDLNFSIDENGRAIYSLNFHDKNKTFYMPNCVDVSLEMLKTYENNSFKSDIFFAMSHGVHRGVLKKGKIDTREDFINNLIKLSPNVKFDCYGVNVFGTRQLLASGKPSG